MKLIWRCWVLMTAVLLGCQPQPEIAASPTPTLIIIERAVVLPTQAISAVIPTVSPTLTTIPLPTEIHTATPQNMTPNPIPPSLTQTATPTITSQPVTPTNSLTVTIEPTPTYWPTVTRQQLSESASKGLVACPVRPVSDDLLLVVTQQFQLPDSYIPPDLVLLNDYFDDSVTLGQQLYAREVVIQPLQQLLAEMAAIGLQPSIISAYRSYQEQAMAWHWWNSQYPSRVAIMSAKPGASEHQLGTTIDFGSSELNHLFHVDFAQTAEGQWLAENAHLYGFTLSYPVDTYTVTGFKYEPWHFRYVGQELATSLYHANQILTAWQLNTFPPPCIP